MNITASIDEQKVTVNVGTTILDAAVTIGITIPTMCHLQGLTSHTSCMICSVFDKKRNRFLPACSAPLEDGMVIQTTGDHIDRERTRLLQLLASEHKGDCNAPCQRTCPAGYDTALAVRLLRSGNIEQAITLTMQTLPLAEILGIICGAPCEKVCRRGRADQPIAIRKMHGMLASRYQGEPLWKQDKNNNTKQTSLAIIGSGPAGLAAAWYASRYNWQITIFERSDQIAPTLRQAVEQAGGDVTIVDRTIDILQKQGVTFSTGEMVDTIDQITDIAEQYDHLIIAWGEKEHDFASSYRIKKSPNTFHINDNIYMIGNAIRKLSMAVTAVHYAGRLIDLLHTKTEHQNIYESIIKKVTDEDVAYLVTSNEHLLHPASTVDTTTANNSSQDDWLNEIDHDRCLICDCTAKDDCKLKVYASEYSIKQFHHTPVRQVPLIRYGTTIIYEEGKCIRCGICVRISQKEGIYPCLTFIGRGLYVRVGPPLGISFEEVLNIIPEKCVTSCPTGALSFGINGDQP